MRRWNGWGEENIDYPLNEKACEFIRDRIGLGLNIPDASLEDVLSKIPSSRLPDHDLIKVDKMSRLCHSCGQSLPDWISLRYGSIRRFTDGVAYPESDDQVRDLINFAYLNEFILIPYGGGTSVVGHINPGPEDSPCITIDLHNLDTLLKLDETSRVVTIGAGATGPKIESMLNKQNFTLGHFPQSFEYSTLGGWIATRSCGQQSYHYGRIEDIFRGGHLETPGGAFEIQTYPASAAGPDIRQLILGSEGRFGVITNACVKIHPIPTKEAFYGVFFDNILSGLDAIREIAQARIPVSMLRLSDAIETETTLALSGRERLTKLSDIGLKLFGMGEQKCLLIYTITSGSQYIFRDIQDEVNSIIRKHNSFNTGTLIGQIWAKSRFFSPYLRNSLWTLGYALDTLETAVQWSKIIPLIEKLRMTIQGALEQINEKVIVLTHISHVYQDGASIYITYIYRRTKDWEQTLDRWENIKAAASRDILDHGGTISHQHGVGTDHKAYLVDEKGSIGIDMIENILKAVDPKGLMNPGKLINY